MIGFEEDFADHATESSALPRECLLEVGRKGGDNGSDLAKKETCSNSMVLVVLA
jgi:hypothetical protein